MAARAIQGLRPARASDHGYTMDRHLEVELKWRLEAEAHARLGDLLAQLLGPPRLLEQRNRFFDTADLRLRAERMNIRLRWENAELVLTCKRRAGADTTASGLHQHDEWETRIDPELWDLVEGGVALNPSMLPLPDPIARAVRCDPLIPTGGFANLRHEFHRACDLVALDRTEFGRRVDHELEVETPDPDASATWWRAQLTTWNMPHAPQPLSKFARMLELDGR